jgi:hypothetical protein
MISSDAALSGEPERNGATPLLLKSNPSKKRLNDSNPEQIQRGTADPWSKSDVRFEGLL